MEACYFCVLVDGRSSDVETPTAEDTSSVWGAVLKQLRDSRLSLCGVSVSYYRTPAHHLVPLCSQVPNSRPRQSFREQLKMGSGCGIERQGSEQAHGATGMSNFQTSFLEISTHHLLR